MKNINWWIMASSVFAGIGMLAIISGYWMGLVLVGISAWTIWLETSG